MPAVATLLNHINQYILNPLILLAFAIATLLFFVGIFQFIVASQSGKEAGDAKKKVVYGLIGMFIMIGAYGIVHIIINTFGISSPNYIQL